MARRKSKKPQKVNLTKLSIEQCIGLVQQLVEAGRIEEAESVLQWLRTKHGNKLQILNALAILMVHKRQYDEAKQHIKLAIAKAPNNADLFNNLGNVHKLAKEETEAEQAYEKAIAINPKHLDALNNYANVKRLNGENDAALNAFNQAIGIDPKFVLAHFNKANVLSSLKDYPSAIDSFNRAISIKPDFHAAYNSLGLLHYKLGQMEQSAEVYKRLLQVSPNHPVGMHMLAAVTEQGAPAKASEKYIATVFDEFAESFDTDLQNLHYRAPELIAQTVAEKYSENAQLSILDAGCGTGLCGPLLVPYANSLTGVDLSPKMIAKTEGRGYNKVVVAELSEFLAAHVNQYDLIVSADTLIYFGDLASVFVNSYNALKPDGTLIFTLEDNDSIEPQQGFKLTHSGRYSHCKAYVEAQLAIAHFIDIELTQAHLRMESGKPVVGLVISAKRSS